MQTIFKIALKLISRPVLPHMTVPNFGQFLVNQGWMEWIRNSGTYYLGLGKPYKKDPFDVCFWFAGKTLIQKYECTDEEGIVYKNVSTYSGWTPSTRLVM